MVNLRVRWSRTRDFGVVRGLRLPLEWSRGRVLRWGSSSSVGKGKRLIGVGHRE